VATVALPGEDLHRWRSDGVVTVEGDITQEDVREDIVKRALTRFGRLDVLVNNAGVGLYATGSNASPELFRRLLDVNVIAPLALTQLVLPVMRRQGRGTIVNLGSVAGNVSMPWAFGYSASKFAVHAFNDALRRELRTDGIRVVKICPGIVDTRFRRNVLDGSVPMKLTKLRTLVSADKVAEVIFKAVESRSSRTVYVPRIGCLFSAIERFCPPLMDWYLGRLDEERVTVTGAAPEMSFSPVAKPGAKR
jgi:short-subunit dehydrogenase